jgi:hypothetical protein
LATQTTQTYSDGHPLDVVQYLESKLILKPDRFDSIKGFYEFNDLVTEAAAKVPGVKYEALKLAGRRPSMREVLFLDTADFRLYNNAFILRRRIPYEDGFPIGDPEVVFKYRHPDKDRAAAMDVRPKIFGDFRVKYKAEVLPSKVQFPVTAVHEADKTSLQTIAKVLPAIAGLIGPDEGRVEFVNNTLVEEVLLDLGTLDFGKSTSAKANVALWRSLADHHVMCGEFAFECKFAKAEDVKETARKRVEQFYIVLQQLAQSWLDLATTKTGLVYRLNGNTVQGHE